VEKLIVNVAMTGCVARKGDNPAIPVTPAEVAADARRCADEGAQVFHVHARDENNNPAWGRPRYQLLVDAVRDAVPGAIVCVSLSGRNFRDFERRSAALMAGPDLATLTMGSVDFPDGTTAENGRGTVRGFLGLMDHWGVRPECEVFDLGHSQRLAELTHDGLLSTPAYANIILGVHVPAMFGAMRLLLSWMTTGTVWGATAIGQDAWVVQRDAIRFGGHVRVGLEDSLWMGKGDPATNPRLVARAVAFARAEGREPMTVEEARRVLCPGS